MIALLVGLIIGFLMCVPIGPINVWVVNTLLKHNFRSAFSIALGGVLMDFVYFMTILSGLSLFRFSPQMILGLKVAGVLLLLLFGLKEIINQKRPIASDLAPQKVPNSTSFFLLGVFIYTSNPTLLATMTGLAALIKSWNLFPEGILNHVFLSLGLSLGSALWFFLLLKIIVRYQNKLPEKFFKNFSRLSGILIVLFSFYMAISVYKEIKL